MLSRIVRPWAMASTMEPKSSSSRTTSATSRATSVPRSPIATPMAAARRAAASLMPSPVIATTSPAACNARTISYLCSGVTPANTSIARAREDFLGGALDGDEPALAVVVDGRHPVLTVLAGTDAEQWKAAPQRLVIEARVLSSAEERAFGGAAADLRPTVRQLRLVAQDADGERAGQSSVVLGHRGAVLGPRQMPAVDRHAVLGDRTRLVRADHRCRPEALDRGQPSHERPLGRHPSNAQGERGGRDRGQTLGPGGDGERDHRAEHLDQWHAAQQPEHERAAAERERHADELAAESIELALERRRRRRRLADQSADAPDLGITSRGRDDGESRAFGDDGAGEDHVDAVGEPGVVGAHLVRPLRDGEALAGQRRLVDRQGLHLDEAGVGGDLVTGPQHQDVADDERGGRGQDGLLLTADEGARHRRVQASTRTGNVPIILDAPALDLRTPV